MKLAFADTYRHVAEPASMQVSAAELLDDVYLAERARLSTRAARRRSSRATRCAAAPSTSPRPTSAA